MKSEIERLNKTAEKVLHLAKKQGATQSEMHASIGIGYSVLVRNSIPEVVEYHNDTNIDITVYCRLSKGSVSISSDDEESVKNAVNVACNIASFTEEDKCAGLADKDLMAKDLKDLDLYHKWSINADQAIELALKCEDYAKNLDKRIVNSEGVSISNYETFGVYANSHGFIGNLLSTSHDIHCYLVAKDNASMERDGSYSVAREARDLTDVFEIAKDAVKRSVARLNPQKISTCKVPVIFEAKIARSLISTFVKAIDGYRLYKKSSFLIDHLEKQIFPKFMDIYESPYLLKGLGSSCFDSNGVQTSDKNFVENGVLRNYCLDYYSACQLGMKTTGNAGGVYNLFIKDSNKNLKELLKDMGKGVFITELIGQGVNLVTGDYSKGAFGFWVENGEIKYPISEVTIACNLKDMFLNLIAVGSDLDVRGNIKTGSILVEEMMVGGK